jgi:F-type H+-transporting ATPase subunit a
VDLYRKFLVKSLFSALFLTLLTSVASASEDNTSGDKKFNAGELIMHHISDSHEWHLWGHTSIPLPVILYREGAGFLFTLSSRFQDEHHNPVVYKGLKLEHNHFYVVNDDGTINPELSDGIWDLSITKNTLALLISISIMLVVFISVAKAYVKNIDSAPKGIQSVFEPIIVFIRDDVAKAMIGEKYYARYMPFLLTVFFFIWFNNLLGLIPIIPGGANVTGNIAIPLTLAAITLIITVLSGKKHYWHHIFAMPGVPKWVLLILTPIEVLGIFIKPFVLMVRLFANITAGHIVLLVFFCLIFIFGENSIAGGYITSVPALAFTIFINCLELLVGLLQAYVFTFLSAIYFGMAVAEPEHH